MFAYDSEEIVDYVKAHHSSNLTVEFNEDGSATVFIKNSTDKNAQRIQKDIDRNFPLNSVVISYTE